MRTRDDVMGMRMPLLPLLSLLPLLALLALAACTRADADDDDLAPPRVERAAEAGGVATGWSDELHFVRTVGGFDGPESVKYDPDQDCFFISNQTGPGSAHDGNGYISRVDAKSPTASSVFAVGGKNGVVLDSPKGITLHGDTLWTADIDKLRAFDRRSGLPLATIDFSSLGAVQLNDLMIAPDGSIHVTDTGIIMSPKGVIYTGHDRIYAVGPNRAITVVAEGTQLQQPNGIAWDSAGTRWIVVSFATYNGEVAAMPDKSSARTVLWRSAHGNFDGVEVLPNGDILFASWADSSVHLLSKGRERQLVHQVPDPADIGVDTRRNRLAIPLTTLGQVQLWDLGRIGRRTR